MKIAFVNQPWDNILPSDGGPGGSLAILSYEFARRLVLLGHEVSIYGAGPRFGLVTRVEREQGVVFRSLRAVRVENRLHTLYQKYADRVLGAPPANRPRYASRFYLRGYGLQVALAIRRGRYDVVHIQNLFQLVPTIRAFNPNIKIVLHMHCEWLSQIAHDIIERSLRDIDMVIGCSEHIVSQFRSAFPSTKVHCRTIYNGVNHDGSMGSSTPPKGNGKPRLVSIGRISPEKGVHLLVEAFAKVQNVCPDVELDIVGPYAPVPFNFLVGLSDDEHVASLSTFYDGGKGTYLEQVKALIPATLADKVRFSGGVPYAEIEAHYRQADVYVNASYSESFCMPVAEAMAHCLPVVAARVGGIQEIVVHNQTGYLFDVCDVDALATGIIQLLGDQTLRETMGAAGRQRTLDVFSYDQVVPALDSAYRSLYQ